MIFVGLHGAAGEDGRLQGMLELSALPFTGSNSHSSALAMDKRTALCLAACQGIPTAERLVIDKTDKINYHNIAETIKLPVVVKPNNSGSSVGITIVEKAEELAGALDNAFGEDRLVICEQYIAGREITVTILDGKALPVVEIKPKNGWYDYINKYTGGKTEYICPAELSALETGLVQHYAEKIYRTLGCEVYARIDFRYDGKHFYFLEANTLPGMTALSLTPMAANAAGYNLGDLLEKIIILSIKKYED
jgi:D-alanine-D-alanine ligase